MNVYTAWFCSSQLPNTYKAFMHALREDGDRQLHLGDNVDAGGGKHSP